MAKVRFANQYTWLDDPSESATAFVADVDERTDAGTIRTWKIQDGVLTHRVPMNDENGEPRKYIGFVDITNVVSDKNATGTLVARTVLSKELARRVADDADLERRAHAMLASEFVELILYHFGHLAPVSARP